ncbi:tetratricopeptide repeat protein [Clostridium gasigenes]|nr:tetratricopeptide repeat protein [Clostridium gasigenes]MBU3089026.1 tetratricopeptide repeat protein [Clostridium gasigenes]
MSKDMKSDYEKALKLYHKGELKKSLECCEQGISKNLKNNSVLNLKGLILYLKGDLEGAITVWKINKDFNEDEMSKTYIRDAENDSERQKEFEKARILIKDLHIKEAIESLNICRESDFNSIQVNNALALCEFKKGEYDKSRGYINKALGINKGDINTLAIKKQLDEFTETKNVKKIVIPILLICIIIFSVIIMVNLKGKDDKISNSNNNIINDKEVEQKAVDKVEADISEVQEKDESKATEENIEEVKSFSSEEIEEYYIRASTYFADGNYAEARNNLDKVIKQSVGNYLNDDILFLLASTYEKLEDINNSIKYFEEYISLYEKGNYIQEVYYKLALQYKSINIEKSKQYANKLRDNYPESIYNNNNIDSILVN